MTLTNVVTSLNNGVGSCSTSRSLYNLELGITRMKWPKRNYCLFPKVKHLEQLQMSQCIAIVPKVCLWLIDNIELTKGAPHYDWVDNRLEGALKIKAYEGHPFEQCIGLSGFTSKFYK